jgi:hypothetical protein
MEYFNKNYGISMSRGIMFKVVKVRVNISFPFGGSNLHANLKQK